MADQTILIIRHAEKPDQNGDNGVNGKGEFDSKSLTPRGWQRAGAWAELLAPSHGLCAKLKFIFASDPEKIGADGSKSRRPLETATPLADKLGIKIDLRFGKGQETVLASALDGLKDDALVFWQHEDIVAISKALAPHAQGVPEEWPGKRYNVVFRFVRSDGAPWRFDQIVPVMLSGDSSKQI